MPFPTFRYHYLNNLKGSTLGDSATSNVITTSTDWVDLPNLSLVTRKAMYMCLFGGIFGNAANERVIAAIYVNGVQCAESKAQIEVAADWRIQMTTMCVIDANEGDIITVRWKVSGGTGSNYRRSLVLHQLTA